MKRISLIVKILISTYLIMGSVFTFPVKFVSAESPKNIHQDMVDKSIRNGLKDLVFSTFLGNVGDQMGYDIAIDSNGYSYITGCTDSAYIPTTSGALDETFNGGENDAFLVKLSPNGSNIIYGTFIGGDGKDCFADYGTADFPDYNTNNNIAIDANGIVYITGYTNSTNFPKTTGAFAETNAGGASDAFVVKISADGSSLVYGTYLGGTGEDRGTGIAIDANGNAYITGSTSSTDFPTTTGAFAETNAGGASDVFAFKLSADGTTKLYSTYLGGDGKDSGNGIAVDAAGSAFITGTTDSVGLPFSAGAFDTYGGGLSDALIVKLSADGTNLVYGSYLGGAGEDRGNDLAIDTTGAAFVTGDTSSPNFPTTPGAFQTIYSGGSLVSKPDAFIVKFNDTGTSQVFSTYIGGNDVDYAYSISVNTNGEPFIAGHTHSNNLPATSWGYDTSYNGNGDIYIIKLNSSGSSVEYGSYIGGNGEDSGNAITLSVNGNLFLTGNANSKYYFPVTAGANDVHYDINDGYVIKLTPSGRPVPVTVSFRSTGLHDGWVLESGESTTAGGTLDSTSTVINIGDGTMDKQYRSILSFNTSSLPDAIVITAVKLKIKQNGFVGSNPFTILGNLRIDIKKKFFGSTKSLVAGDFQATPSKASVGIFNSTPVNNWYSAFISSIGYPYINTLGTTQFRLYFSKGDNDDFGADYMKFFSGNYSVTTARPILTITYYAQ
jgi:hypothetical protein